MRSLERYFQSDETEALNTLIAPHITTVLATPLRLLGDNGTMKYLTHVPVMPHQGLRVSQRSLRCGSYVMPTTELKFDYGLLSGKR